MPSYIVTARGGLFGKTLKVTGSTVEMSEKDALSLPPGTVEAIKAPPAATPIEPVKAHAPKGKDKP